MGGGTYDVASCINFSMLSIRNAINTEGLFFQDADAILFSKDRITSSSFHLFVILPTITDIASISVSISSPSIINSLYPPFVVVSFSSNPLCFCGSSWIVANWHSANVVSFSRDVGLISVINSKAMARYIASFAVLPSNIGTSLDDLFMPKQKR